MKPGHFQCTFARGEERQQLPQPLVVQDMSLTPYEFDLAVLCLIQTFYELPTTFLQLLAIFPWACYRHVHSELYVLERGQRWRQSLIDMIEEDVLQSWYAFVSVVPALQRRPPYARMKSYRSDSTSERCGKVFDPHVENLGMYS